MHISAHLPVSGSRVDMIGILMGVDLRNVAGEILQKSREEAARLKSAFVRNISDEFRTPLNIMVGHTELLMEFAVSADEDVRSSLTALIRASDQLERHFQAILDLSRMESGAFAILPETVMLPLIESQLSAVQPYAEQKMIMVASQIEDADLAVIIDQYCLKRALSNLLDNAIKFTERGQVTIRAYRDGINAVCIDVEDSGIGISPSYAANLFDPFSQADSSVTRRFGGMGLGLALTRRYLALNRADCQ